MAKPAIPAAGADDVLHRRRDLCPRFLTDELRPLGHFGDRVPHVGAAMSGAVDAVRWAERRRRWAPGRIRFDWAGLSTIIE